MVEPETRAVLSRARSGIKDDVPGRHETLRCRVGPARLARARRPVKGQEVDRSLPPLVNRRHLKSSPIGSITRT